MNEGRKNVARLAVLGGGIVLLGVGIFAATREPPAEPMGVRPMIRRDAGPGEAEALDAGATRTISRLDGAVQIHLPVEATRVEQVLGPDEMRARRQAQLTLIEQRIEELDQTLLQVPDSTVLRARAEQLRERRDTLRRLLAEGDEAAPTAPEGF